MIAIKGIGILLHWLLKLALLPVIIVLIFITGMFDFAGGVIQMICGLFGAIFIVVSIASLIMGQCDWNFFWQGMLIGMLFGGVPAFLRSFGTELLSAVTNLLSEI